MTAATSESGEQNMSIDILPFDSSFCEELIAVWRPSRHLAAGVRDPHTVDEDRNYILTVLVPNNTILLARNRHSGEILGFSAHTNDELNCLYVRIDQLGQGVGTLLLNRVKEMCGSALRLFTFATNTRAQGFYLKHQFVEIGRNYPNELNLPDIRYEWIRDR